MNNHYIYIWKEQGVAGSGLPFYVGQGTHHKVQKYSRMNNHHHGFCQRKANKLKSLGTPHVAEVLYDNITKEQADEFEMLIIARLGRRHNGTGILTNLTAGGDVNPMNDESVRIRQLEYMKSEENRARASVHSKKNWRDPEYRGKIMENNPFVNRNPNSKKIVIDGVEYVSLRQASIKLNLRADTIREKLKKGEDIRSDNKKTKVVYEGIEYDSIKSLAEKYGIPYSRCQARLVNGIRLDAPIRNVTAKYGDEILTVTEICGRTGRSRNYVTSRIVGGEYRE